MNLLFKEVKKFSCDNWWIYIIFILSIFIIWYTNTWNLIEIVFIFFLHFLWDIFIMMSWDYYSKKDYDKGRIAHIFNFLTFLIIWFYSIFRFWEWQYILANILFAFPALKSYLLFKNNEKIKYLNIYIYLLLSFIILFLYIYFNLINSIYSFIQVIWFIIFAMALSLNRESIRYFLSITWTFLISLGSFIGLYFNFIAWNILWTTLSFALLSLTVFVFYLKNLKKYL